jgi:uncharacterized ferredoxin-like protein
VTTATSCALHPDRPAAGICGSCGLAVCSACVGTSRDGMLRCHACGFGQATSGVRDLDQRRPRKLAPALMIVLATLVVAGLVWLLL